MKAVLNLKPGAFLLFGALFVGALAATSAVAQTGSLRGQVTDQNGAIVVRAKVTARLSDSRTRTVTSDNTGVYSFANLPASNSTIEASAPSLVLQEPVKVTLKSGAQTLNLQLSVFIHSDPH